MRFTLASTCMALCLATPVLAGVNNPFTEGFDSDASNWRDLGGGFNADWHADGYITTDAAFNTAGPFGLTLFRGQDAFDSSNDAFVGDWISAGVTTFMFDIRHNAPVPVSFFARFATSNNSPAFAGVPFQAPALPGQWTTVTIDVTADSLQLIPEGPVTYESVFGAIGNIQIGLDVPDGFDMDPTEYTFDLDNVRIVPTPAAGALIALGLAGMSRRRRH